jgi:hypothetical protein|tara:strand:- start:47 stop:490 length:444 start_codon:yes stop_codon:yes gene_type:complete
MSYKGKYKPKNPYKYKGDPTNIIYRSLWELKLMMYLDDHRDVDQWASEEFFIPYKSPIDGRMHRYFPDFWIKKNNGVVTVVEVKPAAQTKRPDIKKKNKTPTGRVSRRYLTEVKNYGINTAKWKAAEEYCNDRKWEFKIMTEKELGI